MLDVTALRRFLRDGSDCIESNLVVSDAERRGLRQEFAEANAIVDRLLDELSRPRWHHDRSLSPEDRQYCDDCDSLIQDNGRKTAAMKEAVRLIEEAPFAHLKLTEAQVVLMDAAREGYRAAMRSFSSPAPEPPPHSEAFWRIYREPEDQSWTIEDPTRPGFVAAGNTLEEAVALGADAMQAWDEAAVEAGAVRAAQPAPDLDVEILLEEMYPSPGTSRDCAERIFRHLVGKGIRLVRESGGEVR